MITSNQHNATVKNYISEIFKINYKLLNFASYCLPPNLDQRVGKKLNYRLARCFPGVVSIWHEGVFYMLAHQQKIIPNAEEWNTSLRFICQELGIEDNFGKLYQIKVSNISATVVSLLTREILNVERPCSDEVRYTDKNAKVVRQAHFSSEIIQSEGRDQAALSITCRSPITAKENLAEFVKNHPYRQDLAKLLIDLEVQTLDTNSTARIVGIVGTIGEYRESLIAKATGAISRQALGSAPEDQPVVAVRFGGKGDKFHYALAALCPHITPKTADQLEIDWGKLIKATKINYQDRQKLLKKYKCESNKSLEPYSISLALSINYRDNNNLFWEPKESIVQTKLLFGNGKIYPCSNIIKGLTEGGVFRRGKKGMQENKISIIVIDLIQSNASSNGFMSAVGKQFDKFRCKHIILNADKPKIYINDINTPSGRAELDEKLEELLAITPDLVFVFLPQSDHGHDDSDAGSLYHRLYDKLLKRGISSQFIYEKTMQTNPAFILNQVIPGVLGKLGHTPFILAEPLEIADYFVGIDVARKTKFKLSGTINACAGVCFYGKQGEFLKAKSEETIVEGEEVPRRFLESLLPAGKLKGKTVAIYRDGRFCGNEAQYLAEWAEAIKAKFILIECRKSGCPRLYNLSDQQPRMLQAPGRGVALKISEREAILVTTEVDIKIGVPRPIRLNIRPEGHQVSIDDVLETTLKFTLLHYGSLKLPRLPVMLHGADKIAGLRLRGVSLSEMQNQHWL